MPDNGSHLLPRQAHPERLLAEQAFSRAAGAPLCGGNRLRLLRDATGNYPAWLAAIADARRSIHLENYILQDDAVGRDFIAALAARAAAGVKVRLLYDWMGSFFSSSRALFRPLLAAGGEVRAFNPLHPARPLGWLARDHRKALVVDGRIGFVSGLCISARWLGNAREGLSPWRDTGLEIEGPAVADILAAFRQTWDLAGSPLPEAELLLAEDMPGVGETLLRVIGSSPYTSGLYRLDQLIAAMATETLWLTDAYFLGTPAYVQALCAAAQDDVDVRLLVPSTSDIPLISPFSRAGYRPLLEAGVRVFEWNGTMLHAKTAVADGRWARVGSSNLNVASWISNYELDVAVEDEGFARDMEAMYLQDLEQSTEIVLGPEKRIRPRQMRQRPLRPRVRVRPRTAAASALRLGNTVAAAMQQRRELGGVEAATSLLIGLLLLGTGALLAWRPELLAWPVAGLLLWFSGTVLMQAWRLWRRPARPAEPPPPGDGP